MLRFLLLAILSLLINFFGYAQFTLYNLSNTGEPVQNIRGIGVTNTGYVYVGTASMGLVEYDGISLWNTYNTSSDPNFPNDYITSVEINSTDIWVSTEFGGIGKMTSSNVWTTINSSNSSLPDNEAWGVQIDANGNIFIPTYSGFAIDSVTKPAWHVYDMANTTTLPDESFYSLYYDAFNSDIWLGTRGNGLGKFNNDTWQFFNKSNSSLTDDTINVIKKGHDGSIWVGTNAGLARLKSGVWTIYTNTSTSGILPGDRIQSIAEDISNGLLYAGTKSGVGIYTISSDKWNNYTTSNSNLPENDIRAVAVDPNSGSVWIGTATQGVAYSANALAVKAKDNIINQIHLSPNPVSDYLNISFLSTRAMTVHLELMDYLGKPVKDLGTQSIGTGDNVIVRNVSDLEGGFYFLVIETSDTKTVQKIRIY